MIDAANRARYDWLYADAEIPEPASLWDRESHGPDGRPLYGTSVGPLEIETKRSGENLMAYSAADIRFTTKDGQLFAFVLAIPTKDIVIGTLGSCGPLDGEIESISLLGSTEALHWTRSRGGLTIQRPETFPCKHVVGFRMTLQGNTAPHPKPPAGSGNHED